MLSKLERQWSGEACLTVVFSYEIEVQANLWITAFRTYIEQRQWPWLLEVVPTYGGLTLYMDPVTLDEALLFEAIDGFEEAYFAESKQSTADAETQHSLADDAVLDIPVCYGGHFGPDLERVATHNGLTVEAVIEKHTAPTYLIYMIGFTPGFPYMGGMDGALETPRLDQPRTLIPEGAVGIAGNQTGIYPMASPGGWNLIGQTPLKLFDPSKEVPSLLQAGMKVRYKAISEAEFYEMKQSNQALQKGGDGV